MGAAGSNAHVDPGAKGSGKGGGKGKTKNKDGRAKKVYLASSTVHAL